MADDLRKAVSMAAYGERADLAIRPDFLLACACALESAESQLSQALRELGEARDVLKRATDRAISLKSSRDAALRSTAELRGALEASNWAIRELFDLPKDGDLFERLSEWDERRIIGEVRLQNAVHNVLAERLYDGGRKANGVAVKFLMRLSMLANEAGLGGYSKENPCVAEAIALLGDPGAPNITEDMAAAIYQAPCRPGPALASSSTKET